MAGVPATPEMHFRNGAVAISYVSTLLLLLAEQNQLSLQDKVSRWLPDLRYADQVTVGQLARMTSGYADYVADPAMAEAQYAQPFRQWTPEELIAYSTKQPLVYRPGTNWNYSHTNYVILGLVIEKATGRQVDDLLQELVLGPLELTNTGDSGTPAIPEPPLHAFASERRVHLKLKPGVPFTEESTYWNPSWTITHGAIQTTNIYDLKARTRSKLTVSRLGLFAAGRVITSPRWPFRLRVRVDPRRCTDGLRHQLSSRGTISRGAAPAERRGPVQRPHTSRQGAHVSPSGRRDDKVKTCGWACFMPLADHLLVDLDPRAVRRACR